MNETAASLRAGWPAGSRRVVWGAVAAAVALMALGLGAGLLVSRSGAAPVPVSSVVIPPQAGANGAGSAGAGTAGAGAGAATAGPADARSSGAADKQSAAGAAISSPIAYGCVLAPTVQVQGRGLAATGVAQVSANTTEGTLSSLSLSFQERGGDATATTTAAQAKVAALKAALQNAGVAGQDIQVNSFSVYGDAQSKQFTVYASLSAQVKGTNQLDKAIAAALQVPGVTGYSSSTSASTEPSSQAVQAAVGAAAAEAKDMASSTAQAAGVSLGAVQSVVAQPPVACGYGPTGPLQIVQVTITYALK